MLKYRLFFGTLMTIAFTAIVVLDGWLDGSITATQADDKLVQGTLLCILIALLIIPAQLELSKLAKERGLRIFTGVSIIASILLGTFYYWVRWFYKLTPSNVEVLVYFSPTIILSLFLVAFALMAALLNQYLRYGSCGVFANCGATCFSILYIGLLSSFVVGIRINEGLWPLLMFIFVVKSADIGAYAIGSLAGLHKFSPKISPSKTWEGVGGAIVTATIVSIVFARVFDIMVLWQASVFGLCLAFLGQFGDLAESMIKRDAQKKDSESYVPAFGGILDIIDSPLITAPFAYLFFIFWY